MYIVSLTAKAYFPDIYFVTLPLNDIAAGTNESRCCCFFFFFLSDNRTTLPTEEMLRCLCLHYSLAVTHWPLTKPATFYGRQGKSNVFTREMGRSKNTSATFPRAIATEDGSPHITWSDMSDEPPSMSAGDQIYTTKSQSFRYFILVK